MKLHSSEKVFLTIADNGIWHGMPTCVQTHSLSNTTQLRTHKKPLTQHVGAVYNSCDAVPAATVMSSRPELLLMRLSADSSLDDANQPLVDLLMREEVARHVTAMYTLERLAAGDWARTRTLMASIHQVLPPLPPYANALSSLNT